ncbi:MULTISPECIES: TatD family hydrolase [Thiomicrorhabdus]|uniref:TatD family hydrolase n=1 Tax=Thiomicrorhabdus heinhorstiae TaxID=2748010 RepID=A0ABS0BZ41_9GAMM|nr:MULTISPECIES: TatD family hydrolase [Thiomicrorhabdus]MBF6059065.1 TatD family hydrolase [Thiomicrorhabdus heinhorstiae]
MLFDTHAHLVEASTQELHSIDYPVLNVTTDVSQWQKALDLYSGNPYILPALGIHPWFVETASADDLQVLQGQLSSLTVYAVGEIGLDFTDKHKHNKDLQLSILEQQLDMAKTHQLPVSLHCQKAHNDMINLLKQYDLGKAGVLHGLGASREVISRYLDLGYSIGVNGVVCRENARRYHEMVSYFSLEHFVLETDYPNIHLPGEDAAHLCDLNKVAEQIAMLTGYSVEDVLKQTGYNARQIFGFLRV